MKGPGMRLDLDVRRRWECPECGARRKTGGEVVQMRCSCRDEGVLMRLVENGGPPRSFVKLIVRLRERDDREDVDAGDAEPLPLHEGEPDA